VPRPDTTRIDTIEAGWPWALPPVTATYATPRARLRRLRSRFLASAFVADLLAGYRRAVAILGGFAALIFGLLVFRGLLVAADMAGLIR
jgi:hypothetical protein